MLARFRLSGGPNKLQVEVAAAASEPEHKVPVKAGCLYWATNQLI